MIEAENLPESDRREGAPHPRTVGAVVGHARAQAEVEAAFQAQMPHAWLLSGPEGIGKATFAWGFARRLLGADTDPGTASRIAALSEPRLALLRRSWDEKTKRLKSRITVDEVRKLRGFLSMSVPDGGRRVIIIDTADDMNPAAANAVLKVLEEPPARTVFLVISHTPSALLPTLRSRCRALRFDPLSPADLATALGGLGLTVSDRAGAISALSGGSAGRAVELIEQDGLALYDRLVEVIATCPALDRSAALALATGVSGRGAEARRDLFFALLDIALVRLAKTGAGVPALTPVSPAETAALARLAPGPVAARAWADLAAATGERAAHALAVNLDPAGLILDILLKTNETAGRVARP